MRTHITHDQAFHEYVALGAKRSLVELRRKLVERGVAPCLKTIQTWSARHGWVARAREHDSMVSEEAGAKLRQAEVAERVILAGSFASLAREAVDAARAAIKREGSALITRAGDIQIMVHAAAEAASRAEVLSGGVSDRQETRGTFAVPSELQDLLDASLTPAERARIGKPKLVE